MTNHTRPYSGVPEQFGLLEELLLVVADLLDAVVLAAAAGDHGEVAERLHREQPARKDLPDLRHTGPAGHST